MHSARVERKIIYSSSIQSSKKVSIAFSEICVRNLFFFFAFLYSVFFFFLFFFFFF